MNGSSGFTLIELMTVLAVAAVLAAVAFPSFTWLVATSRTKNASSELFLSLLRARSEAVKLNRSVTIARVGDEWEGGWELRDPDGNVLYAQGATKGTTVVEAADLATVTYMRSGRIQGAGTPQFEITAAGKPDIQRCITADPSGRPYVKDSGC